MLLLVQSSSLTEVHLIRLASLGTFPSRGRHFAARRPQAFSLRRRWHPASPASRMTDEVEFRSCFCWYEAAARRRSTSSASLRSAPSPPGEGLGRSGASGFCAPPMERARRRSTPPPPSRAVPLPLAGEVLCAAGAFLFFLLFFTNCLVIPQVLCYTILVK